MTSKEALRLLETRCRFYAQDNDELQETYEAREKIEKDLEVLDIIKRSIFSKEIHKYVMNEKLKGQKFMSIGLSIRGDNDIDKVKDWLEDE